MQDDVAPGSAHSRTSGQWKQDILRTYNRVKQDVSGTGVERQQIHLHDAHFLIVAVHQRVPALATIARVDPQLGRWGDVAIIDANKEMFATALSEDLGIQAHGMFQDYDPTSQTAVTVVLLASPLPFS